MLVLTVYKDKPVIIHRKGEIIAMIRVPNSGQDGKLRVGFDAPKDVSIDREDVYVDKFGKAPKLP